MSKGDNKDNELVAGEMQRMQVKETPEYTIQSA